MEVGAFSEIVKLHLAGVAVQMEGLLVAGDDLGPWPRLLPGAGEAVEGEAAAGALVGVVAVVAGPAHSLVLSLHVLHPLQTLPAPPAPASQGYLGGHQTAISLLSLYSSFTTT